MIDAHKSFSTSRELLIALMRTEEFKSQNKIIDFPEKWMLCKIDNGSKKMWIDLGDRFVSFGCLHDNYEPVETTFIRSNVKENMHVLDIGANIGWFTLLMAGLVGPGGRVNSFEPRNDTYYHLSLSVGENEFTDRVRLFNFGLSDSPAVSRINWGTNSDNRGGAFVSEHLDGDQFSSEEIGLVRLDDLSLRRVDFVKIDVEGFEPKAIAGGKNLIGSNSPLMLSEINFDQLQQRSGMSYNDFGDFMKSLGYSKYAMIEGKGAATVEEAALKGIDIINVAIWSDRRSCILGSADQVPLPIW
ncbi:FkbM family methyltransferase [Methylobacterium fujisawaense]|uniref:FkbM family methyltransferase n=1 Tax=Methylobacterium fujisawaense TaxID=107400 RepID=UPI002F3543DC